MGNVMSMMKEMSKMDGFGDMLKQFGGGALGGMMPGKRK